MSGLTSDLVTDSDTELISRVRSGDVDAYGMLFNRHREAAMRLARQLSRGPDVDDLVSEAFAKVLHLLHGGRGPRLAFRAYLLTVVRRLHVDRLRAAARVHLCDEMEHFDAGIPFQDTAVEGFERSAASRAFASLPERWQLVLWRLEVEGHRPPDIAASLAMTPNGVSALAYRAREGLRQAFLQMHLADTAAGPCRRATDRLGAYVRQGLSRRDTHRVQEHLETCRDCTKVYLELSELNGNLRVLILGRDPLLDAIMDVAP